MMQREGFIYLSGDVFENLVNRFGGFVECPFRLLNLGGSVFQILVYCSKVSSKFLDVGLCVLDFYLDPLFRLLVASQRFILACNDRVEFAQPRLGSLELLFLKPHSVTGERAGR